MKPSIDIKDPLLKSALSSDGIHTELEILNWVGENLKRNKYAINLIPLAKLRGWQFSDELQSFGHESGKFFQIQGLQILLNIA